MPAAVASRTSAVVDSIPPIVDKNKKLIERGRVKTTKDVQSIHSVLFEEDRRSSLQRALYQELIDGKPPQSSPAMKSKGLGNPTNINWNLARQGQEEAEMPYNGILESLDILCSVPTRYGDETERAWIEPKLAEGFTRFMRKRQGFDFLWQYNAHLFVTEGLSFAFFEDERNWEWKIKGQQDIKFPRGTQADVNDFDVVSCMVPTQPHRLYQCISRKGAADAGWNVAATRKALIETCKSDEVRSDDWQAWESKWKNNDISMGMRAQRIKLIHLWVQELDGTVTRLIARFEGEGEILYKSEGKITSMSECLIAFPYNVGTNGDFHSIRGYGAAVFPAACAINRVFNKFIDMACHVSTPHISVASEDGITDTMMQRHGAYMVLTSGAEPTEIKMPPFESTLIPVISTLQSFMGARSSSYTQGLPNQIDRTERTATEKKMQYATQGKLSSGGLNLFFQAKEKLWKEVLRRFKRENYQENEPGGKLVWEFRNWCLKEGIPLEAIYQIDIDGVEVNTGIGKGSAQERITVLEGVAPLVPYMDAYAKNHFHQKMAAAYLGNREGTILFPREPGLRPSQQESWAEMENQVMLATGEPMEVKGDQDPKIHLLTHLPAIDKINQQIQEGTMQMAEAIPRMKPLWLHCEEHFKVLPQKDTDYGAIKQALSQIKEVVVNEEKKLNAEAQRAQEAAAMDGGGESNDRTANDLIQSVQAGLAIKKLEREDEFDQAKKERELLHADQKTAQALAFKAGEAALKRREMILNRNMKNKKGSSNKP